MTDLDTILRNPLSRREFLTRMTTAGLGVSAAALLAGCGGGGSNGTSSPSNPGGGGGATGNAAFALPGGGLIPGTGDTQVLNYALALETTEADIYRQALNLATGLPQSNPLVPLASTNATYTGLAGSVPLGTGISSANSAAAYAYLKQYAYVEAAHRDFLLTALGHSPDTPGQQTTANTTNPVLHAAGYKFQPATPPAQVTLTNILMLILAAEETGVTAYLGAVPFISTLSNAQTAAAIYSTEARHSSGIRYIFNSDIGPGNLTATGTAPTGAFVSGSAQPRGTSGLADEFEYALAPSAVLSAVVSTFYN